MSYTYAKKKALINRIGSFARSKNKAVCDDIIEIIKESGIKYTDKEDGIYLNAMIEGADQLFEDIETYLDECKIEDNNNSLTLLHNTKNDKGKLIYRPYSGNISDDGVKLSNFEKNIIGKNDNAATYEYLDIESLTQSAVRKPRRKNDKK
jgi:hypothetical protein